LDSLTALSEPRRQTRRIALGTAIRLVGRTLGALISLVALREATRYFGPVAWGPVTAALSWFTVFSYIGSPGLAMLTMREIARPETDRRLLFGRSLSATLVVSVTAAVACVALAVPVYWDKGATLSMVTILAIGVPLSALFMTGCSVLVGAGRSTGRALMDPVSSVFLLVATLVVVEERFTQTQYAGAYVLSVVAGAIIALGLAAVAVKPKFEHPGRGMVKMLKASAPLGQFDLFAVVYARADSVMLFLIRGSRPTAWYGLAFQVATFIFVLPGLLANALLPDFMAATPERRQFLARRALDVMLTIALPLPLFGVIFARPFAIALGGKGFAGAGPLLAILTFAASCALVNGYLSQIAVYAGAEKGLWRAIGGVTVTNLAANAVAVTFWSATGAASVMILSEVVGLVLYWRLYRGTMPNPLGRRYPASVAAATTCLVGLCVGLHLGLQVEAGTGLGILPRVAVLLVAYSGLVYLIAAVGRRLGAGRRDIDPAQGDPAATK
jgi:O-antigen/teichoic acid export membrane protein